MMTNAQNDSAVETPRKNLSVRVFGVGGAGINVMESMLKDGLPGVGFLAVNTDAQSLAASRASEKVHLETQLLRGLGTGGDHDRGRALAEEQLPKLKSLCEGADVVFILAGLGGGAGTGISPVLARAAKEAGALGLGL
jgi:cell division protein FtsZ